jgi:hypothetical protein
MYRLFREIIKREGKGGREVKTDINFETYHEDIINKPNHYHQGGIDVIGFSELQFSKEELKGFFRINILKYTTRYDRKGGIEDLEKALFYMNKLIELERGDAA